MKVSNAITNVKRKKLVHKYVIIKTVPLIPSITCVYFSFELLSPCKRSEQGGSKLIIVLSLRWVSTPHLTPYLSSSNMLMSSNFQKQKIRAPIETFLKYTGCLLHFRIISICFYTTGQISDGLLKIFDLRITQKIQHHCFTLCYFPEGLSNKKNEADGLIAEHF